MEAEITAKGLPTTAGPFRRLKAMGFSDKRLGKLTGTDAEPVMAKRRKLGVRPVFKRIDTCAAEFASPTAYMYSTYETPFAGKAADEAATVRQEEGHHPRRRPEPHRPGHRVRLLLLPCRLRAEGGRLRDHHDQLQSGDGVDRLRHLRPALFRAADAGRRAGDHRHRAQERHAARRDRAVRRTDAAQARRAAGKGQGADPRHLARMPSISPKTATASRSCSTSSSCASRRTASRLRPTRRARSPKRSAIRW